MDQLSLFEPVNPSLGALVDDLAEKSKIYLLDNESVLVYRDIIKVNKERFTQNELTMRPGLNETLKRIEGCGYIYEENETWNLVR